MNFQTLHKVVARLLALFQTTIPVERWLLRSAWHLDHLADLAHAHPDARVIWLHRDPAAALATRVAATSSCRDALGAPSATPSDLARSGARSSARSVVSAIDGIESWPQHQVFHLQYAELVEDPAGTVERVYRSFGMDLVDVGRRRMQQWAGDHRVRTRPVPPAVVAGIDQADVRAAHADYTARHRVPTETLR